MKPEDPNWDVAMASFMQRFCPIKNPQRLVTNCLTCRHFKPATCSEGREVLGCGICIHPKHPRNVDGLEVYVLEAL
jgi:hypothetical protein